MLMQALQQAHACTPSPMHADGRFPCSTSEQTLATAHHIVVQLQDKKKEEEERKREMAQLYAEAIKQPKVPPGAPKHLPHVHHVCAWTLSRLQRVTETKKASSQTSQNG
eukprot:1157795-Pelagomonas_calceolata.AAC.2